MKTSQSGYLNWDAQCTDKHWTELFKSSDGTLNPNIIYLSGDSPNNIPDCGEIQSRNEHIFIIGGVIDHNQHKGIALERAESFQVQHGQLPIKEHITMAQRRILAIPHVFEIMLLAANNDCGQEWGKIFKKVIPLRKLASENTKKNTESV